MPYPRTMDKTAADLIQQLLVLNPVQRLGVGEPGSNLDYKTLKSHAFFKGIDWAKLEAGLIDPNISDELL